MSSVEFNMPVLLGAVLFVGGALLVVVSSVRKYGPTLWQWLANAVSVALGGGDKATPEPSGDGTTTSDRNSGRKPAPKRNSDKQPPSGFTEHVDIIRQASNGCPADVQVEYLTEGLTEAETLRREVARLAGQHTLNGAQHTRAQHAGTQQTVAQHAGAREAVQ